jgi:hypothetical protein
LTRLRLAMVALSAAFLVLSPLSAAHARVSTFLEPFDGGFSQAWTTFPGSLPKESLVPFRPNVVSYGGGQSATFTTLDAAGVARLGIQNAPSWSRFGYLSRTVLSGTIGEVEARVNTMTQGEPIIDGLFDLWLVSSRDHSRFIRVGMFGDLFDTRRSWTYSSSLTPYSTADSGVLPPFAYQNITWYRVRITQFPGRTLEVAIWNDAGDTRLVSHRFPHTLADLGSSFQIGFSQWMGGPHLTHSLLCAIDNIYAWLAQ